MKKFIIVTALSLSAVFAVVALTLGITTYSSSYTREYVATGSCSCWYDNAASHAGHVVIFQPSPGHMWSGGEVGPMVVDRYGQKYWPEDARDACAVREAQADAFAAAFPWAAFILFTCLSAGIILLSTPPDGHRPA